MGSFFSSPDDNQDKTGNSVNKPPTSNEVMNNINQLTKNFGGYFDETTIDKQKLAQIRDKLLTDNLTQANVIIGGRRYKPANKYNEYNVIPYLNSIKQKHTQSGGNVNNNNILDSFEQLSEIQGIEELKKIIDSMDRQQLTEQNGGYNQNLDTSPIFEGIKNAFINMKGGKRSTINVEEYDDDDDDDEPNNDINDDDNDDDSDDDDDDVKEYAFSDTSALNNNNNDSFTVSSINENTIEDKAAGINILPFYSSESSSSFQHPYTKSRFN